MKRFNLLSMMLGIILSSCSQGVECHIQGTIDDPATTEMFLIEATEDIRTMDSVLKIPVIDGKFQYVLATDMIRLYELIPVNQYMEGSFYTASFIAENQDVTISFTDDDVLVSGNGKEQKMVQQYKEEVGNKYRSIYDSIEKQRDSVENILQARMDAMTEEEMASFISDFSSKNSTDTDIKCFWDFNEKCGEALFDEKTARIKWLEQHPCFYGLAEIYTKLLFANPSKDPVRDLILSYRNTYSKQYPGHPYHELITNIVKSKELIVGNKYIDYKVSDYEDKSVNITSLYTGRIILIDLWASWCAPCRRHSMEIIPIYEQFKDKGFQVIAIARERRKEDMFAAMEKDGYPWRSLIELNDQNRIWAKNGVNNAGGRMYLISDDGTILAVNPTAEQTEQILKEQL